MWMRFPRLLLLTVPVLLLTEATWATAAAPTRIVSINLCTDELLIALANPQQIAALSTYATDQHLSFFADQAQGFRHDAGDAETVIALNPDLVLAGRYTKRETREMLHGLGYRVVEFDAARSIADSVSAIREVAGLVGHPERGETLVAEIERARARAATALAGQVVRPTVAFYQRRGYVTGGDTLTGELLGTVGMVNKGGALAGDRGGFVPLEELIAAPPDYLIVSAAIARAEDQGSALLAHPALAAPYPPAKRIVLPDRLTVCGGPSLPAALDWLAGEAASLAQTP